MTTAANGIADRSLQISLTIHQWMGTKRDHKVSRDATNAAGASASAGKFTKALLPESKALKSVQTLSAKLRAFFMDNTLPWEDGGKRILPTANFMEFMDQLGAIKDEWEAAVDNFVNVYNANVNEAQSKLGTMFKQEDYPSEVEVRRRFAIVTNIIPLPASDFRLELPEDVVETIKQQVVDQQQDAIGAAMSHVWDRLASTIEHASSILNDPDSRIHPATFKNIKRECALLRRLNLTNDSEFSSYVDDTENSLCSTPPSVLRSNEISRANVAKEADRLVNQIRAKMETI